MHGHQLVPSGTSPRPDLDDHLGDPVHHLRPREHVRPASISSATVRRRAPSTMKSVISATASDD
jgi:hypothetical protein